MTGKTLKITTNGIFLLSLLWNAHCTSVRIELKPKPEKTISFVHYSHYGLFGLIGKDSLDIRSACMGEQPASVRNYVSFEDFLFTVTLLGLYTPKSTEIHCALSQQEDLPLDL